MNDIIKTKNQQLLKASAKPAEDLGAINLASLHAQECGIIENADPEPSRKNQYRLAASLYEGFSIHGLTYFNMKNPKYVTLFFTDRSKIVDSGLHITASGGTPKDNAQRIIELAKLKKWNTVRLSGSLAFVEAAMSYALAAGLDVSPIDEEQRELWARIQATEKAATVEQINANAASVGPLSLKALGVNLENRRGNPAPQQPRQRGRGLGL